MTKKTTQKILQKKIQDNKQLIREKIGKRIKLKRKLKQMSRDALGTLTGVSDQQIAKYEQGVSALKLEQFVAIANALETPPEWFFDKQMINVPEDHKYSDLFNNEESAEILVAVYKINNPKARKKLLEFLSTVNTRVSKKESK